MPTDNEKYISLRRLGEFKELLDQYKQDKLVVDTNLDNVVKSGSLNPITSGGVYNAIYETNETTKSLVDRGSKNLLYVEPGVTHTDKGIKFTTNSDGAISYSGTASTTGYATYSILTKTNTDGNLFKDCMLYGGITSSIAFAAIEGTASPYTRYALSSNNAAAIDSIPTGTEIHVYVRVNCTSGTAYSGTFKPMICTVSDWEASTTFVPYAPSNRELFEADQELSETKANNLKKTLVGSGSLNDISTNEFAIYTSAVTGKPQSGYAFVRTSVFDANAALQELTMLDGTYAGRSYVRVKNSGTWTSWRETTSS